MNFTNLAIKWDFNPILFELGSIEIRYYSIMWALAFMQGMIVLSYIIKRENEPKKFNDYLFWYITISTILGARIGHCLFYEPMYYLTNPIEILNLRAGGLASHGATIGIMIGLYIFSRRNNKTYLWILDRAALLVPIGAFLVRMGNFFNSEIYGIETTKPWGFIFVNRGEIVAKHPTQLYEAIVYLSLFFILMYMYKKLDVGRKYPGMLIGTFFTLLFSARFFIEIIKENQEKFEETMFFNMGQWLSIPFVILGISLIVRSLKTPEVPKPLKSSKK